MLLKENDILNILYNGEDDCKRIKEIEATCNHDVKSMNIW